MKKIHHRERRGHRDYFVGLRPKRGNGEGKRSGEKISHRLTLTYTDNLLAAFG